MPQTGTSGLVHAGKACAELSCIKQAKLGCLCLAVMVLWQQSVRNVMAEDVHVDEGGSRCASKHC